ncbi:hypothetical protein T484DRAFT_1801397 [Baffinella frigidus]|nr:hypothetical protein T484DRAFT_1801397 [Cryptophyta sp. CCMP2293]
MGMQKAGDMLLAGRSMARENPATPNSDLVRFKTRMEAVMMYSLGGGVLLAVLAAFANIHDQVVACVLGLSGSLLIILSLVTVHLLNRYRVFAHLKTGVTVMVLVKVCVAFFVPLLMHVEMGGVGHSYHVSLWTVLAPLAAVFLFHNHPLLLASTMLLVRTLAIVAVALLELDGSIDAKVESAFWS